ncbi:MAG: regulator, partial [Planctomycetes bacterium]|nr:regulator [Planctomycetota bacterium]
MKRKTRFRLIGALGCWGLVSSFAWAARAASPLPPLYTHWINYTPANGFPAGEVYCVAIDGQRIWAGTEHGLVLIEQGRVKKVFTRADGLAGYAVMSIAVNRHTGSVWVASLGGLSRYSAGKFTRYTVLSSGLANDLVYSVAVHGKYVWAATAAGVSRFNTWTHTWHIFSVMSQPSAPFKEPWAYALSIGPQGLYGAVGGGGVVVYNPRRQTWRPYLNPAGSAEILLYRNQGLISNMVSSLAHRPQSNSFWAGTYFGLSGYDGRRWHNYLRQDSGLASNFVNSVALQGRRVWAAPQRGLP